jgi:hypothetical protein
MPIPEPHYDHYPYEQHGVGIDTAKILRSQDRRLVDLQHENRLLKDELYRLNTWRKKVIPILEANDININAIEDVMDATRKVFQE